MKKTLLAAAAIVAFAGAAHAQSSVTIYGKVDLGLVLDSGNAAGKSVRVSSGVTGGSRLGFKGVEDLGGGMKASFQLETGICADSAAGAPNFCTGNNQFMGRQAHGDLAGAFGLLTAGRVYSFDFVNQTTADPFGTGYAGDSQNLFGDKSTSRLNNTVQYTTPSFSGLTASAEIAFGETTGNWEAGRETGAAVTYVQGPAYVSFTFLDVGNANGQGAARKNYELGATYDFGVVKLHGLVEKSTGNPTGVARPLDALDLLAGVTVPLAGGNVLASYIHHDDRNALTAPGGGDRDAQQLAVGYNYPLSKRTSIYTSFARIQNQHGATFTVGNATEAGTGNKSFDLGVVHNF
jgi:predicted porin